MPGAAESWHDELAAWAIPPEILAGAPESPWIHPVSLFAVRGDVPDSVSHRRAREALDGRGTVVDVGCGGGRASVALVPPATRLVGVDHQQDMLDAFAAAAAEHGVSWQTVLGDWPDVADRTPRGDVVVCHHVVYNVGDLVPFLHALSAHARRRVVLELPTTHPLSHMAPLWGEFWGLERPDGPTAEDCLAVVAETGVDARLEVWDDEPFAERTGVSPQDHAHHMRVRLCLPADREPEVAAFLATLPPSGPRRTATIWWDV